MEIILKQDVEKLGYKDDLVKVKNGYGRNYLIPKGLAILANESVKKMHTETLKQRAFKAEKIKDEAQKTFDALKSMSVKVGAKVGENGKIFGSVNILQVADAIKKLGFEINRKGITLKQDTIKQVGKYEAEIKFHRDIVETIDFEVVEE
ncbi:MAG: 50S ribosomal protein L9 [Flavobacteriales bacterium]|nr:MAG: 50S ribosomal protein L9 [Flavobacteriales bacterium]